MKAFIPIDITDAMLISSTIAEPDVAEPLYDPDDTYAEFALVSVISTNSHLVFESLVNDNRGNNPLTTNSEVLRENAKWIRRSYTNRFRMFDWNQGNPSVAQSPATVVLRPGKRIDALMLEGLKAALVDVTIRNGMGGDVAFTLDGYLLARNLSRFTEFFYAPFIYIKSVVTFEIPQIPDPVIYLTLSDPSGTVELSRFAFGRSIYLGPIQWNPVADSDNYSEVTRDKFGRATLTPIPSTPLVEVKLEPDANRTNAIRQFKEQTDARAVVWSALDDIDIPYRESLAVIGVWDNFSIDIGNNEFTILNLSLKGI